MNGHLHPVVLHVGNVALAAVSLAAWAGYIPPAMFAIVVYAIQIAESDTAKTVLRWLAGKPKDIP
ncbi:MAG TPA: hypothetical protein VG248_02825 [Caulobacteraceae bacterium]|jgi:hypothetical protein|nr:hypothetical protein [Caulobacteraceae bacterium]